ncbi:MAG: GerMN domain-containing protein, partial [Acidimicrobiia bacterium]|nr:GerMN domain-containing protein [Acidimicrobiia bacterium]
EPFLALAVVAAGCGGDDDEAGDTTTSETTTTSDTTTTATSDATGTTTSTTVTTTEPVEETVEVYFSVGDGSDCSRVEPHVRNIGLGVDPIRAAFDELIGGPSPDEASAGATSFFSSETANVVSAVSLTDGLLVVDFADLRTLIPNASTSCGSEALLAQLNNTAFQFSDVDRVRYRIEGSCDDFANWLQRDCFDADRSGQQLDVPTNERASGSGCTPTSSDSLPDGLWFGFIEDPQTDQVSFDLACWFTGAAAAAAAAEDGEESPPPNDFHIRNESDRLRTLAVDPSAEVAWLPNPGDPESLEVVTYHAWLAEQPGRPVAPGVWLNVEDGRVISIEEQYVP